MSLVSESAASACTSNTLPVRAGDFFSSGGGGGGAGPLARSATRDTSAPKPAGGAAPQVDYSKYGNAKSISSDAYFGNSSGADSASQVRSLGCVPLIKCWAGTAAICRACDWVARRAQAQLKQYAAASSISSADYFGDGSAANAASQGSGEPDSDEFMSRLSLQMRQEMSQVKGMASDVGKRLGNFMQSLNNY